MRVKLGFTTLPLVWMCAVSGCVSSATPEDEMPNEPAVDSQVARTDYAFFSIKSDLRKCTYPTCGGWMIQRLNQSVTRCSDGRLAATCYTPVLDWSQANLPEPQQAVLLDACTEYAGSPGVYAIVRGKFARMNHTTPRPELGRFVITEAWLAENDALSTGTFVGVKDNGVRCFVAPCPSFAETALNLPTTTNIAAVDFTPAALTEREVEECTQLMSGPTGILVAGDRYTVNVDGRTADGRTATAAYYRLTSP
jgi:hypothetical protein